jgi:hypothetical protein
MLNSLVLLCIITFLFNKNLNYFNDLTVGGLINANLFSIKYLIYLLIIPYLSYINFTILLRIVSLIKGIKFFYKEIKLNSIEDIKYICIYFYIFNLFLMSISTLFVLNIYNNIYIINSELQILTAISTSIISLLILLFYFKKIINYRLVIEEKKINTLTFFIFKFFIIWTFVILLNVISTIFLLNDWDDINLENNDILRMGNEGFTIWLPNYQFLAYMMPVFVFGVLIYICTHPELADNLGFDVPTPPDPEIALNEITRQGNENTGQGNEITRQGNENTGQGDE